MLEDVKRYFSTFSCERLLLSLVLLQSGSVVNRETNMIFDEEGPEHSMLWAGNLPAGRGPTVEKSQ